MSAWDLKLRPAAGDGSLIVVCLICLLVVFWRQGTEPPQINLTDLADGSYLMIDHRGDNKLMFVSKFSGTHLPAVTPNEALADSTNSEYSVSFSENSECPSAEGTLKLDTKTAAFLTVTGETSCQVVQFLRLRTPYQILSIEN
ncbi:hypothetical protein [Pseudomonas azerbaijanoccidentalis]|jgi:hypothetical protein